jgi:hypothetical protein
MTHKQSERRLGEDVHLEGSFIGGSPTYHKRITTKRTHRVWKPKQKHPRLVLGMDVGLSKACNLDLCALVGRITYKERCKQGLEDWLSAMWKHVLGYVPEVHILQKGWLGFIFKNPKDTVGILETLWGFGGGSLMLKRWRIGFNPTTEYFSYIHI